MRAQRATATARRLQRTLECRSEIFRRQPRSTPDAREHPRADLLALVEGKYKVGKPVTRQRLVGARLALELPTDSEERGEHTPRLRGRPSAHERTSLRRAEGDADQVGTRFLMLEAVRENPQG